MLDRKLYRIIINTLGLKFFDYYPDDFSKRIIVQKTLYLLTHGKTNPKISKKTLPYKWNFYLHGPYSSEIAHMIFYMNDYSTLLADETNGTDKTQNILNILDPIENEAINHFKAFYEKISDSNYHHQLSHEELYEMLATITYIANQLEDNKYKSKIEQKFALFKPELREKINSKDFDAILSTMCSFGYI